MIIFFDIDGTLLNYEGKMPESTYEALQRAKDNGHKLILCTGRCKCGVTQLRHKFNFDGMICSAGAYVEYEGQVVFHKLLSAEAQDKLIHFFEKVQAVYGLQTSDQIVCPLAFESIGESFEESSAEEEERLDDLRKTFVFVEDIWKTRNVEKAFYYGANVGLNEAQSILEPEFEVRPASYNMPDPNNGEICLNGITKSYGMQKLLDYLHLGKDATIAFGDGYNDMEMLAFAGIGVAMGNAVDELKEIADYVTGEVNEDGMREAMQHFQLI